MNSEELVREERTKADMGGEVAVEGTESLAGVPLRRTLSLLRVTQNDWSLRLSSDRCQLPVKDRTLTRNKYRKLSSCQWVLYLYSAS